MPVFQVNPMGSEDQAGVRVSGLAESQVEPLRRYEPGHPMADGEGYIYASNVNAVEEMVNMISSARSYQSSVEILNTSKDLMMRTLSMGK